MKTKTGRLFLALSTASAGHHPGTTQFAARKYAAVIGRLLPDDFREATMAFPFSELLAPIERCRNRLVMVSQPCLKNHRGAA